LGHHDERAPEERRVREPEQQMLRRTVRVHADRRLRQLGETNREILVCTRVVHAPVPAIAARIRTKDHTTELKGPVEIVECGKLLRTAKAIAAAPALG